jgi:2-dehydropantoate 2-reductase
VSALLGGENLLVGIAEGFGASVVAPGQVHHNRWEAIHLGEFAGGITDRLRRIGAAWRAGGFRVELARAKRITLPYADPVRWVREFGQKVPRACPSMLLDMDAGRATEIDVLNGAVAREAERLGVAAPVNRLMTGLVKALEEKVRVLGRPYGVT